MSVPGDDYSWKAYQRFNSFILMIRHFHSQQKRMSQEKNHHTQVSIWVTFSLTVQEDHTWCWALWEHKHRWWKMHSVRSSLYENIVNVLSFSSILIIFYVYSQLIIRSLVPYLLERNKSFWLRNCVEHLLSFIYSRFLFQQSMYP